MATADLVVIAPCHPLFAQEPESARSRVTMRLTSLVRGVESVLGRDLVVRTEPRAQQQVATEDGDVITPAGCF